MKYLTINAAKNDTEQNEILVHGPIGSSFWDESGISGKQFTDALNKFPKGKKVTIGVNSQGGAVGEGLAIFNAIQRRSEDITVRIDGYAISIASVFPLAASKIISPKSSIWMIHNAWAWAAGNAEEMRKQADVLDTHDQTLVGIYAKKTGKSENEIKEAMAAETWFSGDEAVDWGLADESEDKDVSDALNTVDFSKAPQAAFKNVPAAFMAMASFKNLPAALGGAGRTTKPTTENRPSPPNGGTTQTHVKTMNEPTAQVPVAPVAAAPVVDNSGDVKALQASLDKINKQLQAEKENRISRELDQLVIDNKLTVEDAKEWLPRCLADETILASLKKLPQNLPGAEPLNSVVTGGEKVARKALEGKSGKERVEFLKNNWNALQRGGIPLTPLAANTVDTALTTDMLTSSFIVVLQNRLPALNNFTRNFGIDMSKPDAKLQVPIVTAGGTAQTGATDFEDATNFVTTIDNVEIDPARITAGAHLTAAQLNSGITMQLVSAAKANEFADKIQSLVNAIITTANFTATPVVSAAGAFGQSEMNALWAVIAKAGTKNIMLHQDYFKQLLPGTLENFNALANNIPGWDNVNLNTYWTGAEANTYGFACAQEAIGVAAGLPLASPNRSAAGTIASTVTVPGINLTVELQEWYSNKTKTDWANWEVYFAAAKGDGSAGVLLKSQ